MRRFAQTFCMTALCAPACGPSENESQELDPLGSFGGTGSSMGSVAGGAGMGPGPGTGGGGVEFGTGGNGTMGPGGYGPMPVESTGGSSVAPPPMDSGVPCDVASLLSARCTACHNPSLRFGAPMSLMTLEDIQAPARSDSSRKVSDVILDRIDPDDVADRMPPTSMPALTEAEKTTFKNWISGGAPGSPASCPVMQGVLPGEEPPPGTGGTSGSGNAGGAGNVGGTGAMDGSGGEPAVVRSGGASIDPIVYDDPEMECHKFLAHASGSMDRPYSQRPGETYVNFTFSPPWGNKTMYSRAIKLVLDPQSKVIHHWLLFKNRTRVSNGGVSVGTGIHADGAVLMHGWAPGASPLYLDPDVGMKLEAGVGYTLEVHFYNSGLTSGDDHSGAELCVTPKVPAHEVTLSWVGTDAIVGTSATGRCTPSRQREPIHIIAAQPHMHLKGRHMKVVINHRGGGSEVIHDEDFSFENQRYYVLDALLNPGDTMTTTCSYNGIATFGPSTNQEMCYFFSLAWPAGALSNDGGALLHGDNTCM